MVYISKRLPTVSYVVASYNHERYVGDLICSVLEQTFTDIELIIVDDGSTDDTLRRAKKAISFDSRATIYAQSNQGVVTARNMGVRHSKGKFISVVDSDDLLPIERTHILVKALQDNPQVCMAYGDALLIDENGNDFARFFDMYPPRKGVFSAELFSTYCFVPAISVMFRRQTFEKSGFFWGPGPSTDYLKWIELGLLGDVTCLQDQILGSWRIHSDNMSRPKLDKRILQYEELKAGLKKLAHKHPDLLEEIGRRRLMRRYARCHFMAGFYAAQQQSWAMAAEQFARAYKISPSFDNLAGFYSTLPLLRWLSRPIYRYFRSKVI